jgi:hypothetical protein
MMGSRGDSPPPVTTALQVLADLLKNADATLADRIAEVQAEEQRVAAKTAALATAEAEHGARTLILEQRKAELDERQATLVTREAACTASAAETARQQRSFTEQSRVLTDREADLAEDIAALAQAKRDLEASAQLSSTNIRDERDRMLVEVAKRGQQAETAAQEVKAAAQAQADQIRAAANAEAQRLRSELAAREQQLAAHEAALRQRVTELRAVLTGAQL